MKEIPRLDPEIPASTRKQSHIDAPAGLLLMELSGDNVGVLITGMN